mmetsp:Transcript_11419/g.1771  ORF Transcript_11419/g.1771 Transcript_11419/m.1771 type:complete len:87 (-) Transcript_11419:519-779(-)
MYIYEQIATYCTQYILVYSSGLILSVLLLLKLVLLLRLRCLLRLLRLLLLLLLLGQIYIENSDIIELLFLGFFLLFFYGVVYHFSV